LFGQDASAEVDPQDAAHVSAEHTASYGGRRWGNVYENEAIITTSTRGVKVLRVLH
jgi:hypothetical protein